MSRFALRAVCACGLLFAAATVVAQEFDPADPLLQPIAKGTIAIRLKAKADGLSAPNLVTHAGDERLFVVDQSGQVRIIDNGQLLAESFLDVSASLPELGFFGSQDENDFDERGLLGLAFHPGFNNPASMGFGKLYTYQSEPVVGLSDFTVALPVGEEFNHQSVVTEWQVSPSNPNVVDTNSRRELLRIDEPQFNHNAGMLAFDPEGFLHISLGDGGAANDNAPGHGLVGNGQDPSNVLGSILRIDVDGSNSANGQYGIPAQNPFVSDPNIPDEVFAFGFRNPFRFSFDRTTGDQIVADVGQDHIEEIDRVVAGGNFGWRLKEGTFAFDFQTGAVSDDLTGLPGDLIDPVAQFDHDEGLSVIGGFVYRGVAIPELIGKYVFGDFSREFFSPQGRLFYADLDSGEILELQLGAHDPELGLFVKGFGEDVNGELYLLAGTNLGPFGTSGQVFRIVPLPEPATILISLAFLVGTQSSGRLARGFIGHEEQNGDL